MLKIAFPTDDAETVSPHLGQALFYLVATVEDDQTPKYERREKPHHVAGEPDQPPGPEFFRSMIGPIVDCQVLVSGGIGRPVFDAAVAAGLQVVLAHESSIATALSLYQAGKLVSDPALIHVHR